MKVSRYHIPRPSLFALLAADSLSTPAPTCVVHQSIATIVCALLCALCAAGCVSGAAIDYLVSGFRPPSIPVIVLNPTISMWVNADRLTDDYIRHWAGSTMALVGLVRVDGQPYRFLGPQPDNVTALTQSALYVTPTRTLAVFDGAAIQLNLTFSQPAFPADISYYQRPYAYITVGVASTDGASHSVQVYLDHAADVVVNDGGQKVDWQDSSSTMAATSAPKARVLRVGQYDNIPFVNRGDGTKNEWGHVYFATNSDKVQTAVQAYTDAARAAFAANQPLPPTDTRKPRAAEREWPGSIFVLDYGTVTATAVSDYFVFAWDDVYTMFYFHELHQPLWRHTYKGSVAAMLAAAFSDYGDIRSMCEQFDSTELAALTAAGGQEYATYTALAHRQATGATVTVWNEERKAVWAYMKEISSDGDVSTVDVIYPAAPFFVLYAPELLKQTLLPVLAYGQNETDIQYALPWAPHHLGTWPVSDITGPEQEQMPMEESANLLIMLAAIAQRQKYDVAYLKPYWPALTQWANYLNNSLPDPGYQLCTDDFEGASPHNVNLALKGILGLGSFAVLLNASGQTSEAAMYRQLAEGFVQQWLKMGLDQSGDHYRLQFDLDNTWSTKYNLMWQYALGLDLFPQSVADMEVAWYKSHARQYGVPLDSRSDMVKCDWLSWAAAFASSQSDAEELLHYVYLFADQSPSRAPFSDWYNSTTNAQIGFTARPVMGGLYARTLVLNMQAERGQQQQQAKLGQSVLSGLRSTLTSRLSARNSRATM